MNEFFETYPAAAWSIVSVLVALCFVVALWDQVKWWCLNTWYSFPLIGKTARLARDGNRVANNSGWFKAERTLCQDYKAFIHIQSEYDFNEKIAYLNKAGDNGRKATPILIWLLTVSLVFVEAKGFSYVLAGYTIPGASESTQNLAAIGLSFIVSVIAVAFTHFAGHELYKSFKIRNARRAWNEAGRNRNLRTRAMPLAVPQSLDDGEPEYTQVSNRVGLMPSYVITWATVAFVVIVAVCATYVRVQSANKLLEESVRTQKSEMQAQSAGSGGMDMGAKTTALPDADVTASKEADLKGLEEGAGYDKRGYWVTFGMLAFLFVFLQGLGVLFGYRWGFAGENSKDAYRALGKGKYSTYEDVREAFTKVVDKAQSKLEDLQQRMMANHGGSGTGANFHTTKTFNDFLEETAAVEKARREKEREEAKQRARQEREDEEERTALKNKSAAAAAVVQQPAPEALLTPVVENHLSDVDRAIVKFDDIGDDTAAKQAFLKSLPEALFVEVKAALKKRKDAVEAAQKQRDAEIQDLL